jgi:hypothetical protein
MYIHPVSRRGQPTQAFIRWALIRLQQDLFGDHFRIFSPFTDLARCSSKLL